MRGSPAPVAEIPRPNAVAPSLLFKETSEWYACGQMNGSVRQGWKLYVPLTMVNARDLIAQLAPLVFEAGLHFKYIKNIKTLRKLNAGMFGYSQIGKCFVIYLPEPSDRFIAALQEALAPYRDQCPAVPCARPFGDRTPLYYRYGSYLEKHLELGGAKVEDDRQNLANAVPEGIEDTLAAYTRPVPEEPAVAKFLRGYPIFQAMIQQGKCGVFHAMNLASETFQEVVLKVGYHRGQVQVDGSDGCTFLRRELAFYKILADRGLADLAPELIDALDIPRKVILALEYIPGTSLLNHKLAGQLTLDHVEGAWAMIDQFHDSGVYVGDAKLANFLATDDGDLRIVDFEAAGIVGETPPDIRTFFLDPDPSDPKLGDQAHFLASILYPYEEGRYSWEDRHVDLHAWLGSEPNDDISAWALEQLRQVLQPLPASN